MKHAASQARDIHESDIHLDNDADSIRSDFIKKLYLELAKFSGVATKNDHYLALSWAVRDRVLHRWVRSARTFLEGKHRTVIYLSAEYLLGPQLGANLVALGAKDAAREAMQSVGLDLDEIIEHEEEPGLGNGGLGRLAACFMDSLATLDIPAIGHGIRYEFGIFDQAIRDGWQVEVTDQWLRLGNPWEIRRWDIAHKVGLGGHTEQYMDTEGRFRVRWVPERVVLGVPYDTPVLGFGTNNANFVRLWSAIATQELDLSAFQVGDYTRAVEEKVRSENITKILYPNDQSPAGKQLRLEQQYFFVSCALQDAIRLLLQRTTIDEVADKFAVQLNDTHPSLAVPELMRLLMDVHGLTWDKAWDLTRRTLSYTNHTLMPEALETWPLALFGKLLPRHLEIIFEINRRFLEEVRERFPDEEDRLMRMSIIDERNGRTVRMAHLATVGGHMVNGVAALHSRLLRETVLSDFAELWPERFCNVTNGVTPRRFVRLANPGLAGLITEAIGESWLKDLSRIEDLRPFAEDAAFRQSFREVKLHNKQRLSGWLAKVHAVAVDPTSLFDALCKRIHEYKRQSMAALYAIWLFDQLEQGEDNDASRTAIFAGKAAPGYQMAKLIIRLIHGIGDAIARAPEVRGRLRIAFVPDFNVKTAQRIYPAADLSEQISTAGLEASGTGNMKFAMNGALTIGTLDGANIEIRDAVGADDFFLFGLTAEQIAERRGHYRPSEVLQSDPELRRVIDLIRSGRFSNGELSLFEPFVRNLLERDPFFVLADFRAYVEAQQRVAALWKNPEAWTAATIRNVASMGRFSSDRSIAEYAKGIWRVDPVPVKAPGSPRTVMMPRVP